MMNSTTFQALPKIAANTVKLRRTRNKLLLLMLMLGSVDTQTRDEGLFVVGAAGLAVTGVIVWRVTAPSDEAVLQDVVRSVQDKNLEKYSQYFQLISTKDQQEQALMHNLYKLSYDNQYQDLQIVQSKLQRDAKELQALKNILWFRSFFNSEISSKYDNLEKYQLQVKHLEFYFNCHANFFKGWNLCSEYSQLEQKISFGGDAISSIRKLYLFDNYPLVTFSAKLLQDVLWIKNLQKGLYPTLEKELVELYNYAADLAIFVKSNVEYDKEKQRQYQDDEEKRKQDIVNAQLIQAQAQLLAAQAAGRHADAAARNAQTEQQRLALEKENNERERVKARVEELRRHGYSDSEIQRQLDFEGFSRILIGWVFGTK